MLRESIGASSPELELSVKQLLVEDALFEQQERRSVHREFLVRPVLLELRETGTSLEGFTRNISFMGASIVTRQPILPKTLASIQVYRLNSSPTVFLAECRWTSPFGEDWNVTGWHFLNVDPPKARRS